jgi:hypothetical protein
MDWFQLKQGISIFSGLHMDALHVHIGVIAQLATAALLRRSVASPWPWLLLAAATAANEWFDLAYDIWPDRDIQIAESIRDGWNTMLLPTVLLLAARFTPSLLVRPKPATPEPSPAEQV